MCGRYALSLRPGEIRQQLEDSNMPSDEAPNDEDVRQSYNFAPGYHGLVYRASRSHEGYEQGSFSPADSGEKPVDTAAKERSKDLEPEKSSCEAHYKLQAMKWGLIPFWTKRSPDYGSMMRTINCRDDSLYEDRGMWTTMKKKKRCVVVAQGFYEWLKKNDGREKIPHFVKRKDGQLMLFAGLWDSVKYEESDESLYTYTIITTDSNKQLGFLHNRMPVILENGSDAIRRWLDPYQTEWNKQLQSLLKPYQGELDCYPVSKDVGKVGNNSPSFIVPLDSRENKNNIANFFGNQKKLSQEQKKGKQGSVKVLVKEENGTRSTVRDGLEDEGNAPKPIPSGGSSPKGVKREYSEVENDSKFAAGYASPTKFSPTTPSKKPRSATSNGTVPRSPSRTDGKGSQKITSFFSR